MKIELETPDWPREEKRDLYIMAGVEVIAMKRYGRRWYIKTGRCNMCGKCCMNVPKNWVHGEKDGNCKHLVEHPNGFICDLKGNRPFQCCVGDNGGGGEDYCSIKWKTK